MARKLKFDKTPEQRVPEQRGTLRYVIRYFHPAIEEEDAEGNPVFIHKQIKADLEVLDQDGEVMGTTRITDLPEKIIRTIDKLGEQTDEALSSDGGLTKREMPARSRRNRR